MRRPRRTLALTLTVGLLATIAVFASGPTPAELLAKARGLERSGRDNQAYHVYRQLVDKHGKSGEAIEGRYRLAEYYRTHGNRWRAMQALRTGLAAATAEPWAYLYRFRLGQMLVESNQAAKDKVSLLTDCLRRLTVRKGSQLEIDELQFLIARAYSGSWQYTTQDQVSEDDRRVTSVIRTYQAIIDGNKDWGDRAARARFERALFHINRLRNLRGGPAFYPSAPPLAFGTSGRAFDARFRAAVQRGLTELAELEQRVPGSVWAARAAYAMGWVRDQVLAELPAAVTEYRKMARRYASQPLARRAQARSQAITIEELTVSGSKHFRSGTRPTLAVRVRNIQTARVRIHRVALDEALERHDAGSLQDAAITHVARSGGAPWQAHDWATGCRADHLGRQTTYTVPASAPGAYLVELAGQAKVVRTLVVISDRVLVQVGARRQAVVMVSDLTRGHSVPVAGARVVIRQRRWRWTRVVSGTTDDGGQARLALDNSDIQLLAVARDGEHYALARSSRGRHEPYRGTHRVHVTTDRPLYRPGHTVQFKVLVRQRDETDYRNVAGRKLHVRVLDPRSDALFDQHVIADADGAFAGEVLLKAKAMLGQYRIHVQLDGRDSHWYGQDQQGHFRVEAYKKPEFVVAVRPGKGDYIPGDPVEVTVDARYYDGQPVRMGQVSYQIHWQRFVTPQPAQFRVHTRPQNNGWNWNPTQYVTAGQATTDENGRLTIRWQTPKPGAKPQPGQLQQAPQPRFGKGGRGRGWRRPQLQGGVRGDGTYSVRVQVVDKSRRQVAGGGQLRVIKQGMVARLALPRNVVAPGAAAALVVHTTTPGGTPSAAVGSVKLERATDAKDGWAHISRTKVKSPATGVARFTLTPPVPGFYRVTYSTSDRRDNAVVAVGHLFAAGPDYGGGPEVARVAGTLRLLSDRARYDVGQTARLLLSQPGYTGAAYVLVSADQRMISTRTVHLKAGGVVFDLPLTATHMPNVHVTAILVTPTQVLAHRRELKVDPAHRRLDIALATDQTHYRPAEAGRVDVRVLGPDGKPRRTAVWLQVFDASLLAIQPEYGQPLMAHFYGYVREYALVLTHSFSWSTGGAPQWRPGTAPRSWNNLVGHPWALGWRCHQWLSGHNQVRSPWARAGQGPGGDKLQKQGLAPGGPAREMANEKSSMAEDRDESAGRSRRQSAGKKRMDSGGGAKAPAFKKARVRRNFQDTACWVARVETDEDGKASVKLTFPDNLTRWKIVARAASPATEVGQASTRVRTRKMLRVRLAAPRFFTERDEVVLTAVVGNALRQPRQAKLVLKLGAGRLVLARGGGTTIERVVQLRPGRDHRVDWRVKVVKSGEALIEVQALTEVESDAVERRLPVVRHGITKKEGQGGAVIGTGGRVAGDAVVRCTLPVPEARDVASGRLKIVLAPSVAVTALEALPYLARYPYGCVEQTMSRFGPTVLVKRSLTRLGLPLARLVGDKQGTTIPAGQWGKPHFQKMSVLRASELDGMVEAGLARLYAFQHGDGGWGWWRGGHSDDYMTAYVADGLLTARECDVPVSEAVLNRAASYLYARLLKLDLGRFEPADRGRHDVGLRNRITYLTYVAARFAGRRGARQRDELAALAVQLSKHADGLTPYSLALVGLACKRLGEPRAAKAAVARMIAGATRDERAREVRWAATQGWWRWYRDPVETAAFGLRALLAVEPNSDLIPGVVAYLVHARRGTRWHSTKTTAICVGALIEYLKVSGEMDPDQTVTVTYAGRQIGQVRFTKANLLDAENTFVLQGSEVKSGGQEIVITKTGRGNLYWSAHVQYFTLEEDITPGGYRIAVRRNYVRVRRIQEQQGDQVVVKTLREPMTSGAKLVSGDEVEVTLEVDSDREYEYLALEERKAAGLEPLRQTSGAGPGIATHMEMRDDRVVIFASRVPRGVSKIVYRLRAEVPGDFHALPMTGYLMYAPDIAANSAEFRVTVTDE